MVINNKLINVKFDEQFNLNLIDNMREYEKLSNISPNEVEKLTNTVRKLRRQTSIDLHRDANDAMEVLMENIIKAVPVQHRDILGKVLLKLKM